VNSPSHYKLAGGGIECIDVMIQLYGLKRVARICRDHGVQVRMARGEER
jgi:hypothetical protein